VDHIPLFRHGKGKFQHTGRTKKNDSIPISPDHKDRDVAGPSVLKKIVIYATVFRKDLGLAMKSTKERWSGTDGRK